MVGGERHILPKILGQPTPVGAKTPILNRPWSFVKTCVAMKFVDDDDDDDDSPVAPQP